VVLRHLSIAIQLLSSTSFLFPIFTRNRAFSYKFAQTADPSDSEKDYSSGPDISLPLSFLNVNSTQEEVNKAYNEIWDKTGGKNPYFNIVANLAPAEHIQRFMLATPTRVQNAVRNTVMGLLGSLPMHAIETTSIGTNDALANLMFQLQMTGYMFKNAEYRLGLKLSLEDSLDEKMNLLEGSKDKEESMTLKKPEIHGKIKVRYESGQEVEVDANAYMAELTQQVDSFQNKLALIESKQKEAVNNDLLLYMKSLSTSEMISLSSGISQDVLDCMKMLVQAVIGGMNKSGNAPSKGGKIITQQSSQGMAQLCMWQLAVGYSLREMEVRQEYKQLLK